MVAVPLHAEQGSPRGSAAQADQFDRVVLEAGGRVSIGPGISSTVTFTDGANKTMQARIVNRTLLVECMRPCRATPAGVVRVSLPAISALEIAGGGAIQVEGRFPFQRSLTIVVRDGGTIDAASLQVSQASVSISGGGRARGWVIDSLGARIDRGGTFEYYGSPRVDSNGGGGGNVRRLGSAPTALPFGSFVDPRDGLRYGTITVGAQMWMTDNLAHLPRVCAATSTGCGIWVYGYDGTDVAAARASAAYTQFGALYDWHTAQNICSAGWHLPSDAEWQSLERHLGLTAEEAASTVWRGTDQGDMVKAGGVSGLNVTFGGWRTDFGRFNFQGEHANYWCSDEADAAHGCERLVGAKRSDLGRHTGLKGAAFSVRCVKT
jgi:uncharacterized protein (TIGR02145 family)